MTTGQALTAITLIRPMSAAIVWGSKRIENRPRDLPKKMRGVQTIIAVHAGKKWDENYAHTMNSIDGDRHHDGMYSPAPLYAAKCRDEGIVGLMLLSGRVFTAADRPIIISGMGEYPDPWYGGPFGYEIAATFAFEKPIPCRGMQGWWPVPDECAAQIPPRTYTDLMARAATLRAA